MHATVSSTFGKTKIFHIKIYIFWSLNSLFDPKRRTKRHVAMSLLLCVRNVKNEKVPYLWMITVFNIKTHIEFCECGKRPLATKCWQTRIKSARLEIS